MKIAILSTYDIEGGAARAAYTAHKGLRKAGVDSTMVVGKKSSDDYSVAGIQTSHYPEKYLNRLARSTKSFLNTSKIKKYKNKKPGLFSVDKYADNVIPRIQAIKPDIINVHWCGLGFLIPETFKSFKVPIVYTLHDMWGFTGGCHYAGDCLKYHERCGACPSLASNGERDVSRSNWLRKQKSWQNLDLTIVCVSSWLANCAQQSSLFENLRVEVIHASIDTNQFKPRSQKIARDLLELPLDKKIILFGATRALSDPRKGFKHVKKCMEKLNSSALSPQIELAIFGASEPNSPPNFSFKTHYFGKIYDDLKLALLYSAADVMLVPSSEEAFGLTACEATACGTPVVCFDSTGLKDIVEHKENGYRATCFDAEDLSRGLQWILEDSERRYDLSIRARKKAEEEFSQTAKSDAYLRLFNSVLERNL